MIRRFLLSLWLSTALILTLGLPPTLAHGAEIELREAHLESTEEGPRLSASFAFELMPALEDAIMRGIPLYFTTEVEISRPRWYWFDEKAVATSQTVRISYNLLTRQFRTVTLGSLQQNFTTLAEALAVIRNPGRWLIAPKGTLKPGQTYKVELHMELDVAQLPKPFQVHALNSSDWRLSSGWETFAFKVDKADKVDSK